jgi:tetratricopeptide (TPR) repeat protein
VGDSEKALFHREQAAFTYDDVPLLSEIAQAHMERGNWSKAADTLARLLAIEPQNAWANYHLGMIRAPFNPAQAEVYLRQAALDVQFNQSARAVRVAIIESRDDATIDEVRLPMLIGLTMIEHNLWQYAELAFDHANTLSITIIGEPFADALAYKSLALDRQDKDGGNVILAAIRADPNNAQVRYLLARHYRHHESFTASLDAMIQAVQLAPESPALYTELSTAYRLVGDLQEAEAWLQAAVTYSENAPEYERLLALFYADEAQSLGADGLAAINDTLTSMPDDPDLIAGAAWARFIAGDEEAGLEQIETALQIAPENPRALFYKARMLLVRDEEIDVALQLLRQVATAENDFRLEAQRILDSY